MSHDRGAIPPRGHRLKAVRPMDGPASEDDVELMSRVARGDELAFEEIYDRLVPFVYGVVRKVVRDPSQSEEATQEVFLEVWRMAARFDPHRGSPRTWILHRQVRTAVDRLTDLQRVAIQLAFYGGYTYREVAELLGAPVGTVKTRMRDGLIRLRDAMAIVR